MWLEPAEISNQNCSILNNLQFSTNRRSTKIDGFLMLRHDLDCIIKSTVYSSPVNVLFLLNKRRIKFNFQRDLPKAISDLTTKKKRTDTWRYYYTLRSIEIAKILRSLSLKQNKAWNFVRNVDKTCSFVNYYLIKFPSFMNYNLCFVKLILLNSVKWYCYGVCM